MAKTAQPAADRQVRWSKRSWNCRIDDVVVGSDISAEIHKIHQNRPEAEALVRKHTTTDWKALRAELKAAATKALKERFDEMTKGMTPAEKGAFLAQLGVKPELPTSDPPIKSGDEDPAGQ